MKTYQVSVYCRAAKAIGHYEWKQFSVQAPDNADRDTLIAAWQAQYSEGTLANYELHHFNVAAFSSPAFSR